MTDKKQLRLVLTGGGTAGHVWPHFALLEDKNSALGAAVASGEVKVFYLGSEKGMERELVEKYAPEWEYFGIPTGKLRRYFSIQNFIDPLRILLGIWRAFLFLYRIRASVVFSKGGFVAAPVVWAAWVLGIPVVIHESDVTPALATRLSLPFAFRALTAFAETKRYCSKLFEARIFPVGIPIRPSLFSAKREDAVRKLNLDGARKTILVMGGSLGAEGMNKKLAPSLARLSHTYNVIHICGKGKTFALEGSGPFYHQYEFLKDEMADVYAASDLAICRAGASSIFELAAARIPMLLIPLGLHQSRGDQIVNSKIFEGRGWAQWMEQEAITEELIIAKVEKAFLEHSTLRAKLGSAPSVDATYRIGELLLNVMRGRDGALVTEEPSRVQG